MEPLGVVMWRLHNTIQRYAWGSHEAIASLVGRPVPSAEPEAELWMGAHARAPSRLQGDSRSLLEAIESSPASMLGAEVHARFGPRLPFLLKVLAAAQPLSLQAHPDEARARAGFAREDEAGIDRAAFERNYRDPYAKPELVCALGPFVALCGFADAERTRALIESLGVPALRRRAQPLWDQPAGEALAGLVAELLTMDEPRPLVDAVVEAAGQEHGERFAAERRWIRRLGQHYPGDPGVVVALLLNLIELSAGDALFLSAGQLHCYLEGTAVEIMGGSDNVLRGGLTPKHVDVSELLAVLDRSVGPVPVLRPRSIGDHEGVYDTPSPAFRLSRIELTAGDRFSVGSGGDSPASTEDERGPEILLCIDGSAALHDATRELTLERGHSAFIPGSQSRYELSTPARAVLFRATVGSASR